MSRALLAVFSLAFCLTCAARMVTLDEATKAASVCSSEFSLGGDAISHVVPWIVRGSTVGYLAQGGGRVYVLSADTGMPPLVAVVDGSVSDFCRADSFSAFGSDIFDADAVIKSNSVSRLLGASRGGSISGVIAENSEVWSRMIGETRVNVPRMAASSVSSDEEEYVIPGFEAGGKFTHWGQHVARELPDVSYDTYGQCAWPLYNYYMLWYNGWGSSNGLNAVWYPMYITYASNGWTFGDDAGGHPDRVYNPKSGNRAGHSASLFVAMCLPRVAYPCGCVATAYSAMFQCLGVTGVVDNASGTVMSPRSPIVNPDVWTNEFRMVYAYDTSDGAWLLRDDPPDSFSADDARYYMQTRTVIPGKFDWDCLPWTYGGLGKTNVYYGIEQFHSDIFSNGYHDGGLVGLDDDGKVMTSGARELCGRVTYNLGILLGMNYRLSVAAANTTNLIHTLRTGVFPGVGDFGYISSSWDGETAHRVIRAGNPVALSIYDIEDGGHCVLAVGCKSVLGKDYTRLFMGWNGDSDAWYALDEIVYITGHGYEFTSIRSMSIIPGYDWAAVPVHGKVIDGLSLPVGGVPVALVNVRDSLTNTVYTGEDGFFRGWVRVTPKGSSAQASDTLTYRVSCGTDSRSFTANSYLLGDGPAHNGRYDNLSSWSSQFPTQNVTFVVSDSRRNSYAYGTPADFDLVKEIACKNLKPLAIVNGTSGTQSEADAFVSRLSDSVSKKFVFYFVDASDTSFGVKDSGYSLMVVDPRIFSKSGLWNVENGVFRHGSFDNDYDFEELLGLAWETFDKKYLWSDHL